MPFPKGQIVSGTFSVIVNYERGLVGKAGGLSIYADTKKGCRRRR